MTSDIATATHSAPVTRPVPDPLRALGAGEPQAFLAPREVQIGDGTASGVGALVRRWAPDGRLVLLVCDAALPRLGLTQVVEESLQAAGFAVRIFDSIVGEPALTVAEEAVDAARRHAPDAVVGMGGGSAMDTAKLAAALATSDDAVADVVGADRIARAGVPLVLIPTTAGTGAEATRVAMLSQAGEKRIVSSPFLVPVGAVLDPLLTTGLPPAITAATGLDALSHAVEALLSTAASTLTRSMSEDAIELLSACLPRAFADGADVPARRGALYGAYLAGLSLNAGVVLGHSIAYTIANRVALPHGITAAMALPYCLAYNAPAAAAQLDLIGGLLPGSPGSVFAWLAALNAELDVPPNLRDLGLDAAEAHAMAGECLARYPRPTNPVPLTEHRLTDLYGFLWAGDLDGCIETLAA
jgi:alcohol dehydrogenase class IV